MKRNKLVLAATSGLVGLSVLAGSMAYAASQSDGKSAEELQQFLTANPKVAAVVADVEMRQARGVNAQVTGKHILQRVAEAVGEDKEKALIGLALDKAKSCEAQTLWSSIAKKFNGAKRYCSSFKGLLSNFPFQKIEMLLA